MPLRCTATTCWCSRGRPPRTSPAAAASLARRPWWPGRRTRVFAGLVVVVLVGAYSVGRLGRGENRAPPEALTGEPAPRPLAPARARGSSTLLEGSAGVAVRDESFSASLQVQVLRSEALAAGAGGARRCARRQLSARRFLARRALCLQRRSGLPHEGRR